MLWDYNWTYMQSSAERVDLWSIQCCLLPGTHMCPHHHDHQIVGQSYEYLVHHLGEQTVAHYQLVDHVSATLCLVLANLPMTRQSSSTPEMHRQQQQCPPAQPQTEDPSQWRLHSLKQNNTTSITIHSTIIYWSSLYVSVSQSILLKISS